MQQQLEDLVCRYLDGRTSPEEVRRLDQAVQSDRQVARMLFEMAALETQLGQLMSLERTAAEISTDQPTAPSVAAADESPLAARTKQARKQQRRWRIFGVAAAAAACAAVVMLMVYNAVRPVPSPSPTGSPLVAKVVQVSGTAQLLPGGTGQPVPLSSGDLVQPGDALRVGKDPQAQLTLQYPDETKVQLFQNAAGALTAIGGGAKRVQLDTGRLFADISPQPAGREMTFATADAEAKVLGTRLRLTAMPSATLLEVVRGEVEFTRLDDLTTTIVSAQQHAVSRVNIPLIPRSDSWPSGQILLPLDIDRPAGVAHDGLNLWVSNGGMGPPIPAGSNRRQLIFKVSPFDGGIDDSATLDLSGLLGERGAAAGLAWDGQFLWVADLVGSRILCIDPVSGSLQKQFRAVDNETEDSARSLKIKDVAVGDGYLWGLGYGSIGDGKRGTLIFKMSLDDGGVIDRFPAPGNFTYYAITYHNGDLWLHGVGPASAGRIFQLSRHNGETIREYLGAKTATVLTGFCSDPTGRLWLVSAGAPNSSGERWLRPIDFTDLQEVDKR